MTLLRLSSACIMVLHSLMVIVFFLELEPKLDQFHIQSCQRFKYPISLHEYLKSISIVTALHLYVLIMMHLSKIPLITYSTRLLKEYRALFSISLSWLIDHCCILNLEGGLTNSFLYITSLREKHAVLANLGLHRTP